MAYMTANDALDTLFVQLQTRLNSSDTAPCENMDPHGARLVDDHGQPDTCLSHDWGNDRGRPRFYYAPDAAAALVNAKFCPACKASWYVAVARNLMFGIVN